MSAGALVAAPPDAVDAAARRELVACRHRSSLVVRVGRARAGTYARPTSPVGLAGRRILASVVSPGRRLGGPEPVVRAVDLRGTRVARVLRADDPVALQLVHDPAGPREPELELGLEEATCWPCPSTVDELGGDAGSSRRRRARRASRTGRRRRLVVAVAEREDVLLVERAAAGLVQPVLGDRGRPPGRSRTRPGCAPVGAGRRAGRACRRGR